MNKISNEEVIEIIQEEETGYSDDSLFNITSFGADMSFRELIMMYEDNELEKPEMQRNYVWSKNEASRFIDSILLGLPVPSIFLAKTNDEKRLIVDGYQRIMTVYDYVSSGIFSGDGSVFRLSKSENINKKWRGKAFKELQPDEQRKIRNFSIHAIVFEQKEPKDDTGMYQIFERINTGGKILKPQEIRNCVCHGKFNALLIELNKNECWRKIYGSDDPDPRMLDVELILRMFAFADIHNQKENSQNQINLVKYLNNFMHYNNNFDVIPEEKMKNDFEIIINFFISKFDEKNLFRNGKKNKDNIDFSNKINPAIMDAVYCATSYINEKYGLNSVTDESLSEKYNILILNEKFQEAISKRTTNLENIKKRASLASDIIYGKNYGWW